jgi:FkbH-like protein
MCNVLSQADAALGAGNVALSIARLRELFETRPTLTTAAQVLNRLGDEATAGRMRSARVAFERSFTLEPMLPLFRAGAFLHGLAVKARVGPFNAYMQEALNPDSDLYRFDPDLVFLAVQTRDLLPELWHGEVLGDLGQTVDRTLERLALWIRSIREHSRATVVVFNFEPPEFPLAGVLDAQSGEGQRAGIALLNRELLAVASREGAYVLDYDALIAREGRCRWHDVRKWLTTRLPISASCLPALAAECLRFTLAVTGCTRKVLVMDLDNVLWGGVVGEDGPQGIELGTEYPGAAFTEIQRVIRALHARGVILAIASKNNPADALDVLANRPEMLLRPEHFAAVRINWNDKAQSIREIAHELNVGLDSIAFLDDNPAERERIRTEIPEVLVLDVPADPFAYAEAVARCPAFERLSRSPEDRERGRFYAAQRQRNELERGSASLEDFYESLGMEVTIASATKETFARVAQLTQKTNQFNVTMRRYTQAEIEKLDLAADTRLFTYRVRDRFGDNGIVGVTIIRTSQLRWEIDCLLLSCRVIGRTIETAILAHLMAEARSDNVRSLLGWYIHGAKNQLACDLYERHGFRLINEEDSNRLWELELNAAAPINYPRWIHVHQEMQTCSSKC